MSNWTIDNIPDQTGRVALVTGANSGLGYETSLGLARRGAEVIMAVRNKAKGEVAALAIRQVCPEARLSLVELDLSDLSSVEACARQVASQHDHLDLLINNAGVMVPPFSRTEQGFELQFGTNHLGHFALTGRLLPLIKDVAGARIVTLSSIAADLNYIDLGDPNYHHKRYIAWVAYGQSKLANQMFTQELARKLAANRALAIAVSAHPGVSATNLFKNSRVGEWWVSHFSQRPEMGALSTLRAACDPAVTNGSYWGPRGFMNMSGYPEPARIPSKALDGGFNTRLWALSQYQTGVTFQF
jgi:NAD(P)-dependent dehydrogenase (short-subunit alcohol dehydrogenase family)